MSEPPRRVVYGEVSRFGHQQPPTYGPPVVRGRAAAPGIPGTVPLGGPATGTEDESQAPYAPWRRRAVAFGIDWAPGLAAVGVFGVGYALLLGQLAAGGIPAWTDGPAVVLALGLVLAGATLGWVAVHRWWRGGNTGQSCGRRLLGLRLVGARSRRPVGVGQTALRDLVHVLDAVLAVGFLWPLWDDRRQTFADKLTRTVVLDLRSTRTGSGGHPEAAATTSVSSPSAP